MENEKQKAIVSSEKLAANRENARRSTGPRTDVGKKRSSQNSWRHGFFAKRLFAKPGQRAQDGADYDLIANGVREHYQPVGFMENLLADKVASEWLRSARALGFEQEALTSFMPFASQSPDRILRYQSVINRQLFQAIEKLERQQEIRKAKTRQDPPCDTVLPTPLDHHNETAEQVDQYPLPKNGDSAPLDCETNPTEDTTKGEEQ